MQIRYQMYQIGTPPTLMESIAKNKQNVTKLNPQISQEIFQNKGIFL